MTQWPFWACSCKSGYLRWSFVRLRSMKERVCRLIWNKKTVGYLSSKDEFIQDQQRIATWGWPPGWAQPASPYTAREGEKENCFMEGTRKLGGYSPQRVWAFSLAESLSGRRKRLSSYCWALLWSSHLGQQKSPKCSTWMQSQKQQNDLFVSMANHSISQ